MTPYETATDQTGNKLPQQPTHKLSFTAIYEQPIAVGDMQLLTTYSYTGDRHADIGNLSVHEIPAYGRWDVRATWNLPEKNLSTTFYVQNLLDEIGVIEYIPISTNSAVRSATTMTNHRQIGLQVIYRLNN
ncbi:MAG: TonB-dependent receptor domain-containing protein, partial [Pseudomonadales bacterium]